MNFPTHNRILLVDDNPSNHDQFRSIFGDASQRPEMPDLNPVHRTTAGTFTVDSASRGTEAREKVAQSLADGRPYAVAFVELRMPPTSDGVETIEKLWQLDPALQVVAVADDLWMKMPHRLAINENFVILKKPFGNIEVLQLAHTLTRKRHLAGEANLRLETIEKRIAARTRELEMSNAELRRSEERFAKAFRASPIPFVIQTFRENCFVEANEAFLQLTGFRRDEVLGRTPLQLHMCLDYDTRLLTALREDKGVRHIEGQVSTKAGDLRSVLVSLERIDLSGDPHLLLMVLDVSERQHLEAQLRQTQKMEAIGQLAAGVAHDFNNLMTIIQGHASLQLSRPGHNEDATGSLQQIAFAAKRAGDLTRQLLAFGRRQVMRPRVIHLNALVRELTPMLRRLIGERIEWVCELDDEVPSVWADHEGLEQVLTNLILNARDAMPRGGRITIGTAAVRVTLEDREKNPEAVPGDYAQLSVTDTGTGIDPDARPRIFEPFFTTKETNKGTGMGLATCYGITKQHDGWIDVSTELGRGSQFRVLFPVTDRQAEPLETVSVPFKLNAARHTILIVEDDEAVRGLVREVLVHEGYRVLEAETGEAALDVWDERGSEVDLLLTDMVMPGSVNGLELARRLLIRRPGLKVIYTSGYSSELFSSDVKLQDGRNYLPKPYLSAKLTAILDRALHCTEEPAPGP